MEWEAIEMLVAETCLSKRVFLLRLGLGLVRAEEVLVVACFCFMLYSSTFKSEFLPE